MNDQWKKFADIIAFTNYIPWESSYENEINEISNPCKELWTRTFVWYDGKVILVILTTNLFCQNGILNFHPLMKFGIPRI